MSTFPGQLSRAGKIFDSGQAEKFIYSGDIAIKSTKIRPDQ